MTLKRCLAVVGAIAVLIGVISGTASAESGNACEHANTKGRQHIEACDHKGVHMSPYTYEAADYQGNIIRISFEFDNKSKVLRDAITYRDAACVYTKIYLGLGPDGTPNSTRTQFTLPAGTSVISAAKMHAVGLRVIWDVLALQITGGP